MKLRATPGAALGGVADIPGDKSGSHRALILAAMAPGTSDIAGLLESEDVLATARALAAMGATLEPVAPSQWKVTGGPWQSPSAPLDCGNSGTAARLLAGAIAGRPSVRATLIGDSSLSSRPMARVAGPLRRMGAHIEGGDTLPLTIEGGALGGIRHRNLPASAQVKTAILLAGLGTHAPVVIEEPVPSRDHGEILLAQFGVDIAVDAEASGRIVTLGAQRTPRPARLSIAADPSSAAFPLVAAALSPGSSVEVKGMLVNPLRTGLYETLERMGARIALANERLVSGEIVADVTVAHGYLDPCQVGPDEVPAMIDEIPLLAVAAAFADGESQIGGLGELRVKESDRLGAIVAGLAACGVMALVEGDTLRIFGRGADRVRGGASIASRGDHRIAMAFLTLGLAAQAPVEVDEAEMIATSFPGFAEVMRSTGARIE